MESSICSHTLNQWVLTSFCFASHLGDCNEVAIKFVIIQCSLAKELNNKAGYKRSLLIVCTWINSEQLIGPNFSKGTKENCYKEWMDIE